ncbi:hypothetical protein BJ742DRAFT_851940 [Cladochytrium replicatum]|nr:hypothetical protein BJ742DRAFT_851940 [Cladochytrium replicatum]
MRGYRQKSELDDMSPTTTTLNGITVSTQLVANSKHRQENKSITALQAQRKQTSGLRHHRRRAKHSSDADGPAFRRTSELTDRTSTQSKPVSFGAAREYYDSNQNGSDHASRVSSSTEPTDGVFMRFYTHSMAQDNEDSEEALESDHEGVTRMMEYSSKACVYDRSGQPASSRSQHNIIERESKPTCNTLGGRIPNIASMKTLTCKDISQTSLRIVPEHTSVALIPSTLCQHDSLDRHTRANKDAPAMTSEEQFYYYQRASLGRRRVSSDREEPSSNPPREGRNSAEFIRRDSGSSSRSSFERSARSSVGTLWVRGRVITVSGRTVIAARPRMDVSRPTRGQVLGGDEVR